MLCRVRHHLSSHPGWRFDHGPQFLYGGELCRWLEPLDCAGAAYRRRVLWNNARWRGQEDMHKLWHCLQLVDWAGAVRAAKSCPRQTGLHDQRPRNQAHRYDPSNIQRLAHNLYCQVFHSAQGGRSQRCDHGSDRSHHPRRNSVEQCRISGFAVAVDGPKLQIVRFDVMVSTRS